MKYMGSKRRLLETALGDVINDELPEANRFIDLFTGSGSVASFVAEKYPIPVVALDLQKYAVALAAGTITRTEAVQPSAIWTQWVKLALETCRKDPIFDDAEAEDALGGELSLVDYAARAKTISALSSSSLVRAFGGYYFSPKQALILSSLRATIPKEAKTHDLCMASLVQAASRAAASPGHTAQPFKANKTAGPFLLESWRRDVWFLVRSSLAELSPRFAKEMGRTAVAEAVVWSDHVRDGDLVFIDPPYSGVHYSRFYHVLEGLAEGNVGSVFGEGRYVSAEDRPRSEFSMKATSRDSFRTLIKKISEQGAKGIVTYPKGATSNGLSGQDVLEIAKEFCKIKEHHASGRFSTLGGNGTHRDARQDSKEMILVLDPK